MIASLTISTQKPQNPAFNYEALRASGIQHIEQTASAIWTDYNIHDPGITTLELLCYALTDLSYRSTYSIPDLLATEKQPIQNIRQHFFSARQILPNRAVTINDYRKLLIDMVGVKNAWLKNRTKVIFADLTHQKLTFRQPESRKWKQVDIQGYYDVLLEFDIQVPEVQKNAIRAQAREVLQTNRNLCEDFAAISEVTRQEFRLCAEIDIKPAADPFDTLAQIFFNIQLYLTPLIKFYKLQELLDENFSPDQIFEGPLLAHGFIKEEELNNAALKTHMYLSDLMREILKIEEVLNLPDIVFTPLKQKNALPNKWVIEVSDGQQPFVNVLESKVVFYKEGMPFRPDMVEVNKRYEKLMADYIEGNDLMTTEDIAYDTGSYQNTDQYYTIQNHFPKNYGVSHWGLPADATDTRKAQAKQWQAYLFFFDQQMANYLGHLSHLRDLFSLEDVSQTYFTQMVAPFAHEEGFFVNPQTIEEKIQEAAEISGSEAFLQRRNLFLDHLLSRYSESFFDYLNTLQTVFPYADKKDILDTKLSFLRNYPAYSSQRFNASQDNSATEQTDMEQGSGLERRLRRLLGFSNIRRHIRHGTDENGATAYWYEVVINPSGKILLKAHTPALSEEAANDDLKTALARADQADHFILDAQDDQTFVYRLEDASGNILGVSHTPYTSPEQTQADIARLVSLLSTDPQEEMVLVEHLLLLPEEAVEPPPLSPIEPPSSPVEPTIDRDQVLLPICGDACDDCASLDSYSFRISIVLPAAAPRFANMDFRHFCERTIRTETPAHILPKVCWVSTEQWRAFREAYQEWQSIKAQTTQGPDLVVWERFVGQLVSLKSVYPPARLDDCTNEEERRLFLLNQNALGTLNT